MPEPTVTTPWWERLDVFWQEDDAPVPDREKWQDAYKRLIGGTLPVLSDIRGACRHDGGDWFAYRGPNDVVVLLTCEGGALAWLKGSTDA